MTISDPKYIVTQTEIRAKIQDSTGEKTNLIGKVNAIKNQICFKSMGTRLLETT